MKKILYAIMLLFLTMNIVYADYDYIYTDWFDYYPEGVEEFRIQSENRYYWYKEITNNNGNISKEYIKEYYASLSGYIKDESTKKTFYRVLNNPYVYIDYNNKVEDPRVCAKSICKVVRLKPYTPYEGQSQVDINNPKTFDNIDTYICIFSVSIIILLLLKKNKLKEA